jgi:uncharacterized protein (TIGR00299 family) protein
MKKVLYLECLMGAAGDMVTAALYELIENKELFLKQINSVGLEGVEVKAVSTIKSGIAGTQIKVLIDGREENESIHNNYDNHHCKQCEENEVSHHHNHSSLKNIETIIYSLKVSDKVKKDATAVYKIIAEAESKVHNKTVEEIHFHELGNKDAIADIVGVCILMEMLSPDEVEVSLVNTGGGSVQCSHGIMPVPAPATALILQEIPIFNSGENQELCTPTGAAIMKYFGDKFDAKLNMNIKKIGYGMGKKDLKTLNCVRAFWGEKVENTADEKIIKLECNLDDITSEELSFACEILLKEGALDIFVSSIQMKKNRSGFLLVCLCKENDIEKFVKLIFRHTSTIGIRKIICERFVLNRETLSFKSRVGDVKLKNSEGFGIKKQKIEFETIADFAAEKNISFKEARKILEDEII